MTRATGRLLLGAILVLALALRVWGLGFGLPNDDTRPDEELFVGPALTVIGGDPNPHMFFHPSLFVYSVSAVYLLQHLAERASGAGESLAAFVARSTADPVSAIVAARALSAACGVATVWVLVALGREWFERRVALAAATFCAVAFLHVRDSHFAVSDVAAGFAVLCAIWAAIRCETRGVTSGRVAMTGVLCGLAASTKYSAALAALPAAVAICADPAPGPGRGKRVAGHIALLAAACAVAFVAATPYALLSPREFVLGVRAQQRFILTPVHAIVVSGRWVPGEYGWIRHLRFSFRYGVGLPMMAAAAAGACWSAWESPKRAAILWSFPLLFYLAMGVSTLWFARWVTPVVPFICLAAAVGVDRVAALSARMSGRQVTAFATAVLTAAIAAPTALQAAAFDRLISKTDTRVLGAEWIEAHYPDGATIYQTGRSYGFVEPRPAARYTPIRWDEASSAFTLHARPASSAPDIIVVLDSALAIFSQVPDRLPAMLAGYELKAEFPGIAADSSGAAHYDEHDAFYAPFVGFDAVPRPGPTVRIYARVRRVGQVGTIDD